MQLCFFSIQSCKTRTDNASTGSSTSQDSAAYSDFKRYVESDEMLSVDEVLKIYSNLSAADVRKFLTEFPAPNSTLQEIKFLSSKQLLDAVRVDEIEGKRARNQFNTARVKFLAHLFDSFVVELAAVKPGIATLESYVSKTRPLIKDSDSDQNRMSGSQINLSIELPFAGGQTFVSAAGNKAHIGFYGPLLSEAIVLTNFYFASEITKLNKHRAHELERIAELFTQVLFRFSKEENAFKPDWLTYQRRADSALLEGTLTIGQAIEIFTVNEVKTRDGSATGLSLQELLNEFAASGVVATLAARMRFGIVAPASLGKFGLETLAKKAEQSTVRKGPLQFQWPDYLDELNAEESIRVARTGSDHGTEIGCPVALFGKKLTRLMDPPGGQNAASINSGHPPLKFLVASYIDVLTRIYGVLESQGSKN